MSELRILHLVPENGIGGVEVAAKAMAAQPDLPCEFKLLFIAGASRSYQSPRIIQTAFRSPRNPLAHLRALMICLKSSPDVLITSLWKSVPIALLTRFLRRRTKLVLFLHSETDRHTLDSLFSRLAYRFADEVWADSAATLRRRMPRVKNKPTRIISFVTQRLRPLVDAPMPPEPRFVTWSRLRREKGVDRSICFIHYLVQRGLNARFDVWGPDQGQLSALLRRAAELGIESRVRFRGPASREQLPELAREASFLLQLSRTEGMGMATVEAMQLGLVPVVTPVGEICSYLKDGENGILVDPEHPEEAFNAITRLLAEPQEFNRVRTRAIETWLNRPLYADEVCAAAADLKRRRGTTQGLGDGT